MAEKKNRVFYFDNLKGLLMFLVVLFHLVPTKLEIPLDVTYSFVFMFHMAFFIMLSGYFSKNSEKQVRNALIILVMYYISALFYYIYRNYDLYQSVDNFENVQLGLDILLMPFIRHSYLSWYLGALFFLRIFCPFITNIKHYVTISFIVAFVALTMDIDLYMLRRALLYLPFFCTGFYLNRYRFDDLKKFMIKKGYAAVGLVLVFAAFLWYFFWTRNMFGPEFHTAILSLGESVGDGLVNDVITDRFMLILYGIITYAFGFAIIYFVACLTPENRTMFSKAGKNSMTILMFHGFITLFIRYIYLKDLLVIGGDTMIFSVAFLSVVIAIVIVAFLSRDTVTKYTVDPIISLVKMAMKKT